MFQSSVQFFSGFGVQGEIYVDDPHRSQSYILHSSDPSLNIIGQTVYTVLSEGVAQAGGTGAFAGFLIDPKQYALRGSAGNPLAASMVLPNYTQADILSMGTIIVLLPAAAAIGDVVLYDTTSGALSTVTPGTSPPSGTAYANAFVSYYTVPSGGGLAVITVNPTLINV